MRLNYLILCVYLWYQNSKTCFFFLGFPCRCNGLFCSVHRYSNEHNCTFDYKQLGAQEIRKNNPLVVGEKVKKI